MSEVYKLVPCPLKVSKAHRYRGTYHHEYIAQLNALEDGCTLQFAAECWRTTPQTLINWKSSQVGFGEALDSAERRHEKATSKLAGAVAQEVLETSDYLQNRSCKYHDEMLQFLKDYIFEDGCEDIVPSLHAVAVELSRRGMNITDVRLGKWRDMDDEEIASYTAKSGQETFPQFVWLLQLFGDFQARAALNGGASDRWKPLVAKLVLSKHGYVEKTETKHDVGETLADIYAKMSGRSNG